ncbi:hypothetical protein LTR95_001936 [Oleoguttula sp. CCFEE 5521]
MAPLTAAFPPSKLEAQVQYLPNGKRRKQPVNLKECELKELVQYMCDLDGPKEDPKSKVQCEPILRLFRKCANGLTVETTSWEVED